MNDEAYIPSIDQAEPVAAVATSAAPPASRMMTNVESSRAVQQVQAALVIAKQFPRDKIAVRTSIVEACQEYGLAEKAFYTYKRGDGNVSGPSIRLAEVMAQNYGNLDAAVVELERLEGRSLAEAYCWDLEKNVRQRRVFEVPHVRDTRQGKKMLTDARDIYEMVANMGSRRLRACILGIIPIDIRSTAEATAKATLARGKVGKDGKPIETKAQRVGRLAIGFAGLGVSKELIEKRLGHGLDLVNDDELFDLVGVFNALRDRAGKREDYFDLGTAEPQGDRAAALAERLKEQTAPEAAGIPADLLKQGGRETSGMAEAVESRKPKDNK